MNEKIKVLALFGKSGAGKDTIKKWLIKNLKNSNEVIFYTTRPKRDNEIDGIDYNFINKEKLIEKVNNEPCIFTMYNKWYYMFSTLELKKDKINIGVFSINNIEHMLQNQSLKVIPLYIQCFDDIRIMRQLSREKNPNHREICRRFASDNKDFSNIRFKYVIYNNSYKECEYFKIFNIPEINNFIKDVNG